MTKEREKKKEKKREEQRETVISCNCFLDYFAIAMSLNHNYYVYILTNYDRTVLYIGVTNSVEKRLSQHRADAAGEKKTFAGKYNCCYVVYMEHFQYINNAIARENELKGWSRAKKVALINSINPQWDFLEGNW